MDNNLLKDAYVILSDFYDDYWILMQRKASNKSEKRSIESQIDIIRDRVRSYIEGNPKLIDYIEFPDEFFSYQWFGRDLKSLLAKLKDAYETI